MTDLYSGFCAPKGRATCAADLVDDTIVEFKDISMDEVMALKLKHQGCEMTIIQTYQGTRHSNTKASKGHWALPDRKSHTPKPKPVETPQIAPKGGDLKDLVNNMMGQS